MRVLCKNGNASPAKEMLLIRFLFPFNRCSLENHPPPALARAVLLGRISHNPVSVCGLQKKTIS
jgi:hypothetical protein